MITDKFAIKIGTITEFPYYPHYSRFPETSRHKYDLTCFYDLWKLHHVLMLRLKGIQEINKRLRVSLPLMRPKLRMRQQKIIFLGQDYEWLGLSVILTSLARRMRGQYTQKRT